jgi:hypothetical protein
MTVSWDESFYATVNTAQINLNQQFSWQIHAHTAFSSAKFPHRAKWALKLAFELPPATPHSARSTPAVLRTVTRTIPAGTIGERQSMIMAISLKTSAASLYVLHSGSRAVPTRWAKRIVAILPDMSCKMWSKRAEVGDASALPTPTPVSCVSFRFWNWVRGIDLGVRLWRRGGLLLNCRKLGGSPVWVGLVRYDLTLFWVETECGIELDRCEF